MPHADTCLNFFFQSLKLSVANHESTVRGGAAIRRINRMNSASRNSPCTCGSGRKFKHCCLNRKPTTSVVGVELETPQVLNSVTFNADGSVKFNYQSDAAKQSRAWTGVHRERKKGEKTILRVDIDSTDLRFGEYEALRKFDFIFAIDTNNRPIGGSLISVSHVMQLRFTDRDEYQEASLKAFVFIGVGEKQENLGWHLLIRDILSSPDHKPDSRYAIVTDSDMGNHADYNLRNKPFYAGECLSKNFEIVYASEEGRNMTNQLIRQCDQRARGSLGKIESGEISINCEPYSDPTTDRNLFHLFNCSEKFPQAAWFRLGQCGTGD